MKAHFEIEVKDNSLGPWVELSLVREDGATQAVFSEPINSQHRMVKEGKIEQLAFAIIADRLRRGLDIMRLESS